MPNVEIFLTVRTTSAKKEFLCLNTCQNMITSANLMTKFLTNFYKKIYPLGKVSYFQGNWIGG